MTEKGHSALFIQDSQEPEHRTLRYVQQIHRVLPIYPQDSGLIVSTCLLLWRTQGHSTGIWNAHHTDIQKQPKHTQGNSLAFFLIWGIKKKKKKFSKEKSLINLERPCSSIWSYKALHLPQISVCLSFYTALLGKSHSYGFIPMLIQANCQKQESTWVFPLTLTSPKVMTGITATAAQQNLI